MKIDSKKIEIIKSEEKNGMIISTATLAKNGLCKKCNKNIRRNSSSYCQQCSDEYKKNGNK